MTIQSDLTKESKTETAVDKAQEIAGTAQQKVSETAAAAKEQAARTATRVGEQAKNTVDARMSDVAQELGSVADAVRQTTQEVGGENQTIAHYGDRIAQQIEGVSSYLDEHSIDDVLNDVQNFARRQPAVFLGGAFMLGIMVGRFLRSSESRHYRLGETSYDYERSGGSSYPTTGQTTGYSAYEGQSRYQSGASRSGTQNQDW
jgi:hypothetical protein